MLLEGLLDSPKLTGSQPLKILLVDDEPATLQLVRRLLQADGHDLHEAIDGEQAVQMFDAVHPDLVLLDVVIPKMDGLEVLHALRLRDKMSGIIMVSALTSEQLAVKSMLGGADDYVNKPFRLKTIRLSIRQVMDKVRLRRRNASLQAELIAANQRLRQYMAKPLVETLLSSPTPPQLGGVRETVSTLFLDFANFTPLSERLPPDDVVQILNEYFSFLPNIVIEHGGFMDKIMGDGFMAIFNAPTTYVDHAQRAVLSAVAMRREMNRRNQNRAHRLALRIGIHTGEAIVGNIGASVLMNYTAIGDAINLTKRLEEASEPGQILITADTFDRLDKNLPEWEVIGFVSLGLRQFKGRTNEVEVFAVEDHAAEDHAVEEHAVEEQAAEAA
ncbi:MAG: adenylate/guanylate cyclase domain-containing protein [Caldilinea sp.]